MKHPTSILRFSKPHPSIMQHPTEKSLECCEWLIKSFTNEGMTVLDNCMGSGSTGVACIKTNRKFIIFEKYKKTTTKQKEGSKNGTKHRIFESGKRSRKQRTVHAILRSGSNNRIYTKDNEDLVPVRL